MHEGGFLNYLVCVYICFFGSTLVSKTGFKLASIA
jgi:hypothetical protein